jgi:ribosome-binding factor A
MADSARARRMAKRVAAIVATELEHSVKDPRLAMVTVTSATVTPDLRDAVVFYTVYGGQDEIDGTAAALASATGVLRSAVGKQTGVKFTPTLSFRPDTLPETSSHMEELLAAARAADAAVAQQASTAAYAGEADPYRVPRAADEDGELEDDELEDEFEDDDDDLDDAEDIEADEDAQDYEERPDDAPSAPSGSDRPSAAAER